jgi:hypothetical protein
MGALQPWSARSGVFSNASSDIRPLFAALHKGDLEHGRKDGRARFVEEAQPNRVTATRPLSRHAVAAGSAGGFLALDLGEQPYREDHEAAEKGHDILDAVMPTTGT